MMNEEIGPRGVTYDEALELNQTIFGSLCERRWLTWDLERKRFVVSLRGRDARSAVNEWDLRRKYNNHRLAKRAKPVYKHRGLSRVA